MTDPTRILSKIIKNQKKIFHIYFSCAVHRHEKRQLKHALMPTYVLLFQVATIAILYQVSSRNSGAFVFSSGNYGASMSSAQGIWPLILALNGQHSCTSSNKKSSTSPTAVVAMENLLWNPSWATHYTRYARALITLLKKGWGKRHAQWRAPVHERYCFAWHGLFFEFWNPCIDFEFFVTNKFFWSNIKRISYEFYHWGSVQLG